MRKYRTKHFPCGIVFVFIIYILIHSSFCHSFQISLKKNFSRPFEPQFGLKIRGGGAEPRAPPLDRPLVHLARSSSQPKNKIGSFGTLSVQSRRYLLGFFGQAKHETGVELETRAVGEGAGKRTPVHTPLFVPFNFIFSAPSAIARVSRSSLALRFPSFALEISLIKKG